MRKVAALLLPLLLGAACLNAIPGNLHMEGAEWAQTNSTFSNALNSASPTVSSVGINASGYGYFYVQVTGSVNATTTVLWSDESAGTTPSLYFRDIDMPQVGQGNYFLKKKGQWLKFQAQSAATTFDSGVSTYTDKITVNYAGQLTTDGSSQTSLLTLSSCPAASTVSSNSLSTTGSAVYVTCTASGSLTLTNATTSSVSACVETTSNTVTAIYDLIIPANTTAILTKERYFAQGMWVKFYGAGTGNFIIKNWR